MSIGKSYLKVIQNIDLYDMLESAIENNYNKIQL